MRFQEHLDALSDGHVDGLLIATAHRTDVPIGKLSSRRLPYVLMNRRRDTDEDASVIPDDRRGAQLAVEYLARLGHRKIAHIAGSEEISRTASRLAGYRETMQSLELPEIVHQIPTGGMDERAGEHALIELMKSSEGNPTAIFTANDLVALGVLAVAHRLGVHVPADLSVIGCDDVPLAKYVQPSLTTIRYPFYDVGRLATEQLIKLMSTQASSDSWTNPFSSACRTSTP